MNDEEALKVLREMAENVKKTTEVNPRAFYIIFSGFRDNLTRITNHIQNDNFRAWSVTFWLLEGVFRTYLDHPFQKIVVEKLKKSLEEEEDIRREIILNAASRSLSVGVLSDDEGRDVVNMVSLRRDFEDVLEDLDESTKILVLLKVSNAIREIYNNTSFIEERKKEMLEFYDNLIASSEKDWEKVFSMLREYLIRWDKETILWKREKV